MKKLYFLLIALCLFTSVNAQIIIFPDANFKAKLLAASPINTIAYNLSNTYFKIDANNDGEIQVSEASQVQILNVSNSSIADLTGIESFVNLQSLNCNNNLLLSLTLSGLTSLYGLDCSVNLLSNLTVNGLINLHSLDCGSNQLTTLDLGGLTNLQNLHCNSNQLATLNLTGLTNLQNLYCNSNQLASLDLLGLTNLEILYCNNNLLASLIITIQVFLTCIVIIIN